MHQDVIVGSGPAGVAAAHALLSRGHRVTMLDVGIGMDPESAELKARLGAVEPDAWQPADLDRVKTARRDRQTDGIRPFGSDFVQRDVVGFFGPGGPPAGIGLRPSFARGGNSNGWGASILPYRVEDLDDWPTAARRLEPHYSAIQEFVPVAAAFDDLSTLFPMLEVSSRHALPMSSQARRLLKRMDRHRDTYRSMGLVHGQARQAVADNCRTCAMCLYGCPYDLIFNASAVVGELVTRDGFTYKPRHMVTRFEETPSGVRVRAQNTSTGESIELNAARLFIGAGVLPTTALVLSSFDKFDHPVPLKDSQHFFLPMLHSWWPSPDPAREPRHTLTQIFWEIVDPDVDKHTVHTQLYAYNDLYAQDMRARFGSLADVMQPLIRHLSRRLFATQTFLHSDASPTIEVKLLGPPSAPHLDFSVIDNPATLPTIDRVKKKLAGVALRAGLLPLPPLVRLGEPGSSYHCGGTFPMRNNPAGLETDILGRPAGLSRVHLIDASTFPSIPATTITLSVMANAHRIATSAPA